MKLFYFGSVCSWAVFNETVADSRVKPSASAQSFESALIKGFATLPGLELTLASAESIAPYPRGNRLLLKKRADVLFSNVTAHILPALNLPCIKQVCHAYGAFKLLKQWLKQNKDVHEKGVLVYGIYPEVVQKLQKACRKHGCCIFAIMPDLPSARFAYTPNKSLVRRLFSGYYQRTALGLQDKFDGYIYLTAAMKDTVAPGKPYIVVETLVDPAVFENVPDVPKASPPALMYAGALYKKYGIDLILESFEQVQTPCELWLFGDGDYTEEIKRRAASNSRIRFFGRVSREEVLKREKEATLLLNMRNAEDEYTKYSFPSKMVEYMLSGTPLLTTKLPCVPDEYDACCYTSTQRSAQNIAAQIAHILQDQKRSAEIGARARAFVTKQKNSCSQAARILCFMQKMITNSSYHESCSN